MARDLIHESVRIALEKDGWTITHDPFTLETGDISIDMDLAAERMIVAEKGLQKIIVEVKSFGDPSMVYSFHTAIGQYIDYRGALKDEGIERALYLAISFNAYKRLNKASFFKRRFEENKVKVIVVNIVEKIIVEWIH
ncbi:MAG: hypothetical protein J5I98_08555 [Phaeodactylibacter sp.]|nr:hypothetical protein [Phaeodactylibacter sp.]